MASFDSLIPELALRHPGVSEPELLVALKRATIEFCIRTWLWVEDLEPELVSSNSLPLELAPPNGTDVLGVVRASFDGAKLSPAATMFVRQRNEDSLSPGTPSEFNCPDRRNVTLYPPPLVAGDLIVSVALAPTMGATSADDRVLVDYAEAVMAGADARVVAKADIATASALRNEFVRMANDAKRETWFGTQGGSARVSPFPFV